MEGFSHKSLELVSTIHVKGAYCAFFPLFCHISRLCNYTQFQWMPMLNTELSCNEVSIFTSHQSSVSDHFRL